MADWNGVPFLRSLLSADCLSDLAILSALFDLKIFDSRSSALLFRVTPADHFLAGCGLVDLPLFEVVVAVINSDRPFHFKVFSCCSENP